MRLYACLSACLVIGLVNPPETRARTVYFNGFDQRVGTEWSDQSTDVTPAGARRFLGPFGSESVTLRLHGLPSHQSVRIAFDLFVIGTWDGSDSVRPGEGPDVWAVVADGKLPLLRTSFDNHYAPLYRRPARQSYPLAYGQGQHPAQTGAVERNTLDYRDPNHSELPQDAVYHLDLTFTHEANDLSLCFSADCIGVLGYDSDERWGLDNVVVELPQVDGQVLLVTSSSEGGTVIIPGVGEFWFAQDSLVPVKAQSDPSYVFDRWSGTVVEQGQVTDPFSAATSVQAGAAYALTANFVRDPGASVLVVDAAAAADPGPGDPELSDPEESGTLQHPFDSIQEAIDAFDSGQHRSILVLSGIYRGPGNRDIDLKGKRVRLYSSGGPEACVIDCQRQGRGFIVHMNEGPATTIEGFTIRSGAATDGGAIYCQASPTFSDCILTGNAAEDHGGAIYCASGTLWLADCTISDCGEESLYVAGAATVESDGLVEIETTTLAGAGRVDVPVSAVLETNHCMVTCDITGGGWLNGVGGLTLAGTAHLNLSEESPQGPLVGGTLSCQGLLRLQDQAGIFGANVEANHGMLEADSVVSDSVIDLCGLLVYGQFMLKDNAGLKDSLIRADSDNFLTFGGTFRGLFTGNNVELTLSGEQVLEVRGTGLACNIGGVQTGTVPSVFDRSFWQLRLLELTDGAIVTLTDHFDDQQDGQPESLYVTTLKLGPDAELDCRALCVQAEVYQADPTSQVTSVPLYRESLGMLDFSDRREYAARVQVTNPQAVELVQEAMCLTLWGQGSTQAKAHFDRCLEGRLLIRFTYLFVSPDVEVRVHLSDSPDLGDRDPVHDYVVGVLVPPPSGRPGSVNSDRYAQAEIWANTERLDLSNGTWVELELVRRAGFALAAFNVPDSASDSASIDDWAVEIHCSGLCLDLNQTDTCDEKDFELVLCAVGRSVTGGSSGARCFEGVFSFDGQVDCLDLCTWEWMLGHQDRLNVCGGEAAPLTGAAAPIAMYASTGMRSSFGSALVVTPPAGLVILDKLFLSSSAPRIVRFADRWHAAQADGSWDAHGLESDIARGTMRLIRSDTGQVYVVNCSEGVTDLSNAPIVAPRVAPIAAEPRYGQKATVAVGLQGDIGEAWGRPVLDAVVDSDAIYVVPVVVNPEDQGPYLAAAKLSRSGDQIEHIYDDSDEQITHSETLDNPNLAGLREIEADDEGNVYVLNAHALNRSTMLWKYSSTGDIVCRKELETFGVVDPVGLCVTHGPDRLVYLACGLCDPKDPQATKLYGLSPDRLEVVREVRIADLHHVTGIAEQGQTGVLWVVGYSLDWIPERIECMNLPQYRPVIARVTPGDAKTADVADLEGDIIIPMSIVWAGQ